MLFSVRHSFGYSRFPRPTRIRPLAAGTSAFNSAFTDIVHAGALLSPPVKQYVLPNFHSTMTHYTCVQDVQKSENAKSANRCDRAAELLDLWWRRGSHPTTQLTKRL